MRCRLINYITIKKDMKAIVAVAMLFVLFGSVLSLRHKLRAQVADNDLMFDELDDYDVDVEACRGKGVRFRVQSWGSNCCNGYKIRRPNRQLHLLRMQVISL